MTIHSQAPARVDLAGGTLDIWPLYLFHENPQTINFAIDRYARCRVTPRKDRRIELVSHDLNRSEHFPSLAELRTAKRWELPLAARLILVFADAGSDGPPCLSSLPAELGSAGKLHRSASARDAIGDGPPRLFPRPQAWKPALPGGFALETDSGVPAGSGLGGSSALNIAICGALARFTGQKLPAAKLIELARNVEAQVLGVPTGEQDYYSAVFGGLQAIQLKPHGIHPRQLRTSAAEINSRFVLCYTGQTRNSGINNWEVQKAHIDGSRAVVRHFQRIAAIAVEMRAALEQEDWQSVARLLDQEWQARKKNYPGITTPAIERLTASARRNGAVAGKVCGAGGGGCVIFLAEPDAQSRLSAALADAGAQIIPFRLATRGLHVENNPAPPSRTRLPKNVL